MSFNPIAHCPITGVQTKNSTVNSEFFEYSIEYNGNSYTIRLAFIEGWEEGLNIKTDEKLIFQGMLYNNEWPIDKETIFSPALISQIMRLGEYPKDFNKRMNYYLLKSYLQGGNEYKIIKYNTDNYQSAYCASSDAFGRIIIALRSKGFITLKPGDIEHNEINPISDFKFTEQGVAEAEKLHKVELSKEPQEFNSPKPRITVVATAEDNFYAETLKKILQNYGISVVSLTDLNNSDSFSLVSNSRTSIYSNETNYIIFIKSKASDQDNSFGSLLDIAIEAHENTDKRNFDFIFFAFIDDGKTISRARVDAYTGKMFDFRIKTNRKLLINALQRDWKRRANITNPNSKKYDFPSLPVSEYERLWLQTVYQKFLTNENFQYRYLLSKMWDKLPKDFEPSEIDSLLVQNGTDITLLGIWHIDPQSDIFEKFDTILYAIKEVLRLNNEVKEVRSEEIISLHPELSNLDVLLVFKLLFRISGFAGSFGTGEDLSSGINVDQDAIYREYRNYNGIEDLVRKLYNNARRRNPELPPIQPEQEDVVNKKINLNTIDSHKTRFAYRDIKNIKPVMGVVALAEDLAEIIDNLPIEKEKGQMIGIFGKWGRGKTFLLREVWGVLEKKENDEKKVYTKVDYHAWKYQETPASWAYLYENLVTTYLNRKKKFFGGINYYRKLLKLNYERLGGWPIVKFFLAVIAAVITPILCAVFTKWYFSLAIIPIVLVAFLSFLKKLYKEFSTKAVDLIKLYSLKHTFKEALGIQADVQDELIKLLKVWIPEKEIGKKKILLIVEDIDRCTEDKIIQNIDALRVMLEDEEISKRVIIVTAIDERILKNAITLKYKSILENTLEQEEESDILKITMNELISEYLDKLFISAIKLGGLTSEQRREYLNELLEQEIDKTSKSYQQFIYDEGRDGFTTTAMPDELIEPFIGNKSEEVGENTFTIAQMPEYNENDNSVTNNDATEHGSTTSVSETDNTINNRINNQNKFEKLSPIEVELIERMVRKWASATPRRLRIFYYRYLLCKNLLINKYDVLKEVNIWQNKEGIEGMMDLILQYTKAHDPNLITQEKARILEHQTDRVKTTFENPFTTYKRDYLFLLEVLELVIAY